MGICSSNKPTQTAGQPLGGMDDVRTEHLKTKGLARLDPVYTMRNVAEYVETKKHSVHSLVLPAK
jgi:hypothetical protein